MKTRWIFLLLLAFSLPLLPIYGKSQFAGGNYSPFFDDSLPFDMCQVMPGSEVAQLSPFPKPLKATKDQKEGLEGFMGCHYDFEWDRDGGYPQIDFAVVDNKTAANSREEYKMNVETFKADWKIDPVFISNLGDAAAFFGTDTIWCDICNLVVISGPFRIEIKFKGYSEKQISAKQKQESGVKLVNSLFQKKPFLKNKK